MAIRMGIQTRYPMMMTLLESGVAKLTPRLRFKYHARYAGMKSNVYPDTICATSTSLGIKSQTTRGKRHTDMESMPLSVKK